MTGKTRHRTSHRDSLVSIELRLLKLQKKVSKDQSCSDLISECLKRIEICINNEARRNHYHKAQLESLTGKLKKLKTKQKDQKWSTA